MAAGQALAVKIVFAHGSSAVRLCHPWELPKARILSHGHSDDWSLRRLVTPTIGGSGHCWGRPFEVSADSTIWVRGLTKVGIAQIGKLSRDSL
ncbi:MAG: hypothetical protein JNK57_01420 [Planctomycetaceae bacterium]|nr:hypothetical protein [Planctomycetaceae bacterium]